MEDNVVKVNSFDGWDIFESTNSMWYKLRIFKEKQIEELQNGYKNIMTPSMN